MRTPKKSAKSHLFRSAMPIQEMNSGSANIMAQGSIQSFMLFRKLFSTQKLNVQMVNSHRSPQSQTSNTQPLPSFWPTSFFITIYCTFKCHCCFCNFFQGNKRFSKCFQAQNRWWRTLEEDYGFNFSSKLIFAVDIFAKKAWCKSFLKLIRARKSIE